MRKWIILVGSVLFFIILGIIYRKSPYIQKMTRPTMALCKKVFRSGSAQRKIIIFSSPGGYGHQSATAALTEYLQDRYEVQSVYLIQDVLGPIDFVHSLTFGNFYSEQLYNYCLVNRHIWLANTMIWCGLLVFKYRYEMVKNLIRDYLVNLNPDLIISVIPVVNGVTLDVAQELHIPFWVIPTDLDPVMFVKQLQKPSYERFFFNIPYALSSLQKHIEPVKLDAKHVTYAGFPVRKQFLTTYDTIALKRAYNIPLDRPVLMMMMGGLGVNDTLSFAYELTRLSIPAHCLICIGKNENLRSKLETILDTSELLSYSIIGFTPTIAPLMAMSDILITKSGGASVNEGLYMEVPMIVDGTSTAPQWEYYNRSFIQDHGCGVVLKRVRHLSTTVDHLLKNPDILNQMKCAIRQLSLPNPEMMVQNIVAELFSYKTLP